MTGGDPAQTWPTGGSQVQIDPYIVLGSAVVGLLVGTTGAGGGALMTPMLILLFGVKAPAAISSDLVAAVLMRPVGAVVHMRQGTVNYRLVGWLALGSVPMAFLGTYLLHLLGNDPAAPAHVEQALGAALLTGAAAMIIRYALDLVRRTRGSAPDARGRSGYHCYFVFQSHSRFKVDYRGCAWPAKWLSNHLILRSRLSTRWRTSRIPWPSRG